MRAGKLTRLPVQDHITRRIHGCIPGHGFQGQALCQTLAEHWDLLFCQCPAEDVDIVNHALEETGGTVIGAAAVASGANENTGTVRRMYARIINLNIQYIVYIDSSFSCIGVVNGHHMMPLTMRWLDRALGIVSTRGSPDGEGQVVISPVLAQLPALTTLSVFSNHHILPVAGIPGLNVGPDRDAEAACKVEDLSIAEVHGIPGAIELQSTAQLSGHPLWIAQKGAVPAVAA